MCTILDMVLDPSIERCTASSLSEFQVRSGWAYSALAPYRNTYFEFTKQPECHAVDFCWATCWQVTEISLGKQKEQTSKSVLSLKRGLSWEPRFIFHLVKREKKNRTKQENQLLYGDFFCTSFYRNFNLSISFQ